MVRAGYVGYVGYIYSLSPSGFVTRIAAQQPPNAADPGHVGYVGYIYSLSPSGFVTRIPGQRRPELHQLTVSPHFQRALRTLCALNTTDLGYVGHVGYIEWRPCFKPMSSDDTPGSG